MSAQIIINPRTGALCDHNISLHYHIGYDDSVELWDCSGAEDYEKCFAALKQDVCGIVYVYNPEHQPQSEGLSYWYSFVFEFEINPYVKYHYCRRSGQRIQRAGNTR